jgi:hypothetical protein
MSNSEFEVYYAVGVEDDRWGTKEKRWRLLSTGTLQEARDLAKTWAEYRIVRRSTQELVEQRETAGKGGAS